MKIAVTYQDGNVFQHFGHTKQFKIYTAENGKILSSEIVKTNGNGHGALADFLAERGVNVLICGGIGGGAKDALAQAKILLYGGVTGNADEVVQAALNGTLHYNADVVCTHHEYENKTHSCKNHNCCEEN
ncbi:MAG: NifB/NifX family molybdenum-iron cluster-binding protein [Christensenellales bacterium]